MVVIRWRRGGDPLAPWWRYNGARSSHSWLRNPEAIIRALVFDFDGLILDSETAEHQAWREIYLEHGAELELDRWLGYLGDQGDEFDPCDQLERQLGELVDRESIEHRRRHRTTAILKNRSILPGVVEYIRRAKERHMLLGVASSSARSWVEEHLERLSLHGHFDVIQCGGDVERGKPAPDLYRAICNALGVAPEETIAIEDSPGGIEAAKAAGLYCVSVPNALTRRLSMDAADRVLLSLASTSLDDVVERARQSHRREVNRRGA